MHKEFWQQECEFKKLDISLVSIVAPYQDSAADTKLLVSSGLSTHWMSRETNVMFRPLFGAKVKMESVHVSTKADVTTLQHVLDQTQLPDSAE